MIALAVLAINNNLDLNYFSENSLKLSRNARIQAACSGFNVTNQFLKGKNDPKSYTILKQKIIFVFVKWLSFSEH